MAYSVRQQIVPAGKRFQGRGTNKRRYLTIHQTDNFAAGADARAHANLQSGGYRAASWHWQVDDKEAVQSYPETAICWHAGDGGNGTGNTSSIAIESCVQAGYNAAAALDNTARLAASILKRNNIPIGNMVQHNRWTGKNCPSQIRKNGQWNRLVELVKGYLKGSPSSGSTASNTPVASKKAVDGQLWIAEDSSLGRATISRWQQVFGTPIDGVISRPSTLIKAVQKYLNSAVNSSHIRNLTGRNSLAVDGYFGPHTIKVLQFLLFNWYAKGALGRSINVARDCDGVFGKESTKVLQYGLNRSWANSKKFGAK